MSDGLEQTWRALRDTKNDAANAILVPVLDSPIAEIADNALRTLLRRRSADAYRQLLDRWDHLNDEWRSVIRDHPGAMSGVLRGAVLSSDAQRFHSACDALVWLREYDLAAALITSAEDRTNPHASVAACTLLQLIEELHGELSKPRDYRLRRDPQLVRRHVVTSLEHSVERYGNHDRVEIVEAFLMLAGRENPVLKNILMNPHAKSYLPLIDLLSRSQRPGIVRLLLSFLDDPHAPKSSMNAMMNRRDDEFVRQLLKKIGRQPAQVVRRNLHRVKSIGWVNDDSTVLGDMDDAQQYAAIQLIMATRINRLQAFSVVRNILLHGKTGGRRAAAAVLTEFQGTESNALVAKAIDDPDPEVQAHVLKQLRQRRIPGAMTRLVSLIDSPHEVIRDAVRQCMLEFRFTSYLATFDTLSEEVRRCTGLLVKKVDPKAVSLLIAELDSKSRTRRLRAMLMATAMDATGQVEERLQDLLDDDDHFVRASAARALAGCHTLEARVALRRALLDRSVMVQEAAEESLESLEQEFPSGGTVTQPSAGRATLSSGAKPNNTDAIEPPDVPEARR